MIEIKSAIVTGGTGVTGNALIRYLLDKGVEVTALVRKNSIRAKYLPEHEKLRIVWCGLEEYDSIDDQLSDREYDAFFHLAWEGSKGKEKVANRNNFRMQNMNTTYALDAVELCHRLGCGTFVMTGSQAEYGPVEGACSENNPKLPVNGYGMAKLCAEGMTRLLCHEYGIRHIWPILFSVYGPRDATESMIDTSIRNIMDGIENSYTKGEQIWNYLYSFDASKAIVLLAEMGEDGEFYNVASKVNKPLGDYIRELYDTVKPGTEPVLGGRPYPGGKFMSLQADTTKLVMLTGFKEDYSFKDGIREIMESLDI